VRKLPIGRYGTAGRKAIRQAVAFVRTREPAAVATQTRAVLTAYIRTPDASRGPLRDACLPTCPALAGGVL